MRHHFIGFAVLLSACSMSGQVLTGPDGGGADGGSSDGGSSDGGHVWRSCETLTADNHGEPCEGPFYCSGTCPCGGEEIRCVDGLVEVTGDCAAECPSARCDAPDVAFDVCGGCDDAPAGFYWDGAGCVSAGSQSCECVGADCATTQLYPTASECEAAHGDCHAALCEATGGTWDDMLGAPAYRCGRAETEASVLPGPSCDCGPGRTFVAGSGCADDASCGVGDLCAATGGFPIVCDTSPACGVNDALCSGLRVRPSEGTACDCGPASVFDPVRGCEAREACAREGLTREVCLWSGGTFDAQCAPTDCGRESAAACAVPACRCGALEIFDPALGCVRSLSCQERFETEACEALDDGRFTYCAEGSACCGGACVDDCRDACDPACDGATGCALPTFACGEEQCVSGREYCEVTHPGPPGPSAYECHAFPDTCTTADCTCLEGAVECDCRASGRDVTLTCALP